jgi:hypothetical protein
MSKARARGRSGAEILEERWRQKPISLVTIEVYATSTLQRRALWGRKNVVAGRSERVGLSNRPAPVLETSVKCMLIEGVYRYLDCLSVHLLES